MLLNSCRFRFSFMQNAFRRLISNIKIMTDDTIIIFKGVQADSWSQYAQLRQQRDEHCNKAYKTLIQTLNTRAPPTIPLVHLLYPSEPRWQKSYRSDRYITSHIWPQCNNMKTLSCTTMEKIYQKCNKFFL